jgi:hypothetical protein
MLQSGSTLFRLFNTVGNATSGLFPPPKLDIQEWSKYVEGFGYKTRGSAIAAQIDNIFTSIMILGWYAEGDGGAFEALRLASAPSPVYANYHFQTADGAWWQPNFMYETADIRCFGAKLGAASGANAVTNNASILAANTIPAVKNINYPSGIFEFSSTINPFRDGVKHRGASSFQVFPSNDNNGTVLLWTGAAAGTGVAIESATTNDIKGIEFSGFQIDGNGLLNTGYSSKATQQLRMIGNTVYNMQTTGTPIGFYFGSKSGTAAELNCTYAAFVSDCKAVVVNAGIGWAATGKPSVSGQAATFCTFDRIQVVHQNGIAFYVQDGDDCAYNLCATSRIAGGTGAALYVDGASLAGKYPACNWFNNFHGGATDGIVTIVSDGPRARSNYVSFTAVDQVPTVTQTTGAEMVYFSTGNPYARVTDKDYPTMSGIGVRLPQVKIVDGTVLDYWDDALTWTPSLTFGGASTGWAFSVSAEGNRTGDTVTVWGSIIVTAVGSATGAAKVAGLPFAAKNGFGTLELIAASGMSGITGAIHGAPTAAQYSIAVYQISATGSTPLTNTNFPYGAAFIFTINYRV